MSTKEKVLLSGNEAIARGAWEAGVTLAAAYPGTPSTEILQNLIQYEEIYAQWSPNEKVAVEFAFGGAVGGARSIASMKHVGLNVAADPFFSASYAGVNGGFVVVSADDPSMHSSQNEQDNRRLGIAAKVPVLEPIDSQTAKDLTKEAFEISERFDTPVLIRTTTRINHGTSVVELGERSEVPVKKYRKDAQKFMMLPSVSRKRRHVVEKRLKDLEEYANTTPFNIVEMNDTRIGIVTAGIAVQHAKEVFPDASYLTLQISYPFPRKLVREFAAKVDKLLVIEELDNIMETEIKAMGIECTGKDLIPNIGELRPEILEEVAGQFCIDEDFKPMDVPEFDTLPSRPPVLCAGCGHRSVFYVLHKLRAAVMGDIGCYTLGAYKPLDAMDTSLAMGASIGMAHGIERAQRDNPKKLRSVAVIGDSTFLHSGITGLMDVVYNNGNTTTIILDNSITAMTGHQLHPGTGETAMGMEAPAVDFTALAKAIGLKHITTVDTYDLAEIERVIREETERDAPSLIIAKGPCALVEHRGKQPPSLEIDDDACIGCGICLNLGCPALSDIGDRHAGVDQEMCVGCDQCVQVCKFDAMKLIPRSEIKR